MGGDYFQKDNFFTSGGGVSGVGSDPTLDTMLNKIYSQKKRADVLRVLKDRHAHHNERLWMVGFLKFAGFSADEAMSVISRGNAWENFNPQTSAKQVESIFKTPSGKKPGNRRSEEGGVHGGMVRNEPSPHVPQPSSPSSPQRYDWDNYKATIDRSCVGKYNVEMMEGTDNIVSEYRAIDGSRSFSYNREPEIRPWEVPLYRTIEGDHHCLAVVDIDSETDLGKAWRVMQRLMRANDFRWVKFSGNKGFHAIDKLRGPIDRADAKRHVLDICAKVDMEGLKPDERMFNPHQLVRTYSINWQSMHYSIPVDIDDTIESILLRSQKYNAG